MAHEKNFKEYQTKFNPQLLEELQKVVKTKLLKSSEKYGETYLINDVAKELREEIIDIVGWSTLEALRLLEVLNTRFVDLDKVYWKQFLKIQSTKTLATLAGRIGEELNKRGNK